MSKLLKLGLVGVGRGVGLAMYASRHKLAAVVAVCDPAPAARDYRPGIHPPGVHAACGAGPAHMAINSP